MLDFPAPGQRPRRGPPVHAGPDAGPGRAVVPAELLAPGHGRERGRAQLCDQLLQNRGPERGRPPGPTAPSGLWDGQGTDALPGHHVGHLRDDHPAVSEHM